MAGRPGWEVKEQAGATDGPFFVLDHTTRDFVIQQDDVVKRVNIYRIGRAPAPKSLAIPRDAFEATYEDLAAKNRDVPSWLVEGVVDHRNEGENTVTFSEE